ncbi:MAG: PEP-CTERM sorting domain-containing protein [Puniceicoccales bacterium]
MNKTVATITLALGASSAFAALDINLPGNTYETIWQDMTASNNTGFPGYFNPTDSWPHSITPSLITPGADVADFDKVSGGGYPASGGIYNTDVTGTYSITDEAPLANLQTIVFQTDMVSTMDVAPVLSINSGALILAADFVQTAPGDFSGMGANSTVFAYQWDLSAIAGITDYSLEWTSGAHTSNYFMQINQGDTFSQVIPEPSTYALFAGVATLGLILMRRKTR